MAMQPFGDRPMAMQPFVGQQMQPQQRSPFPQMDMMDQMMMSPFGGGGRGGGMFGMMDQMMNEMMSGMGPGGMMMGPGGGQMMGGGGMMMGPGDGQMMQMGGGGMNQMMQMSSMGGDAGFSCQSMMMSSHMGEDGQRHTERFHQSTVGDRGRRLAETQQAYSNSYSGIDKMSLERQNEDRARKMVKEYNQRTGEERNTDLFRGMTEADTGAFESSWQQNAVPYMPRHASNAGQLMNAPQASPFASGQAPYASRSLPGAAQLPSSSYTAQRPSMSQSNPVTRSAPTYPGRYM